MNLIERAVSQFTNTVPASGSPAERKAIDAACNAGFNAPQGAEIPAQFESIPLLKEWYEIGLKAQAGFCHPVKPDDFGFGR